MAPEILLAAAGLTMTAQILTTMVAFFVVLAILYKMAWGPVLELIDERRKTIAQEFDTIDKKQADLNSMVKDYEERLRQIDNEARERTNKAIDEGKKAAAEILEEARKHSEDVKQRAEADIKIEIEKARVELRDEIVNLTLGATEKLLHKELNADTHKKLIVDFIEELEKREAS